MNVREQLPAEQRLLVNLNRAKLSVKIIEESKKIVGDATKSGTFSWLELAKLADKNQVVPLTLHALKKANLIDEFKAGLDLKTWQNLNTKAEGIHDKNSKRRDRAKVFFEEMSKIGVEVIGLKGFMFADVLYNDPSYKKMNDADILVKRSDVQATITTLKRLQYFNYAGLYGKDEVSDKSHHTPAYISKDLECVVGLHWGLVSPQSPFTIDATGLWARRKPAVIAGTNAYRMSWEDNVLHLCVHLPFYKTGLRELADVYNCILDTDTPFDWAEFDNLVSAGHAEDPVYRVFSLVDQFIDLGIPRGLLDKYREKASAITKYDVDTRLKNPELILKSRSVHIGEIEKAYVTFRKTENLKESFTSWLKVHELMFAPKQEEVEKLSAQFHPESFSDQIKARVIAPIGIMNAMAQDHGYLAIGLMSAHALSVLGKRTLTPWKTLTGKRFSDMEEFKLLEFLE